ncbi:hypothetical protein [Dyella sp. A6]|uniref:hypothetical protein n=1 Tax=Dyella aluminiiresistens TaxID=3069105 RepID=UPI002E78F06F|nr:hypothetical protein [Dyella sp. A6]
MKARARHHAADPRRQRGAIAIAMMLMLLGLISILGIAEVGYLYWAHNDVQKVADMAALSGAQQLTGTSCAAGSTPYVAASGNAVENGGTTANGYTSIDISCGGQPANGSSVLLPASASSVAAIKVVAHRQLPALWGLAWKSTFPVNADAVAVNGDPIAAFSVGSRLLGIDSSSPLNQLLNTTLGTSLGLQLLSYNGIANTDISLLDLVKQMNIDAGTVDSVLQAPITVGNFLDAYAQVLSKNPAAAGIDLTFVDQQIALIKAQLGDVPITLGDVLDVNANTTDPNAALNTNVNALDILSSVIMAGDSKNAVALPATTVGIPGIASVSLTLSIIEPPQIGVGGVGTTAHTAQVRLGLDVSAVTTSLASNESLLSIPLYLEVAPSDATITSIQCEMPTGTGGLQDNVTIQAIPGVLKSFLGSLTPTAFDNTTESWASLINSGSPAPLVNVSLAGLPVAAIEGMANVTLATTPTASHTFNVDTSTSVSLQSGMTWIDGTPSAILGTAITSLLASPNLQLSVNPLGVDLGSLLDGVTALLQPVLTPLFDTLDQALIGPLLQTVGIQIGTADVNLMSVNCNPGTRLVY